MPKAPHSRHRVPVRVDDLPAPDTKRWHIHRKAQVVDAVRAGVVSLEEACRRYQLSADEFASWQQLIEAHGLPGLRVTYGKRYRDVEGSGTRSAGLRPLRAGAKGGRD